MRLIYRRPLMVAGLLAVAACSQAPASNETGEADGAAATPAAATMSAADVVQQHVDSMKTGDMDAIMSDYSDDTVVITPQGLVADQEPATGPGVYVGKADAQRVFSTITANMDAVKGMETTIEPKGEDVAFLHWVQMKGQPNEVSGTDVFVVRNSKIEFQDIIVDAQ